jgi:hypothetical protein
MAMRAADAEFSRALPAKSWADCDGLIETPPLAPHS